MAIYTNKTILSAECTGVKPGLVERRTWTEGDEENGRTQENIWTQVTGRKTQEAGEICIPWVFITCILH
jgi:hypothetical protein